MSKLFFALALVALATSFAKLFTGGDSATFCTQFLLFLVLARTYQMEGR